MRLRKFAYPALCSVALIFGFACSPMSAMDDSSDSASSSFTFTSPIAQVASGQSIQLSTMGGSPPYSYSVLGDGSMTSSGVYLAPTTLSTNPETVQVSAQDSNGQVRVCSLTVTLGSTLTATLSPTNPGTSTLVTITPSGGVAPYRLLIISGSGNISGSTYTTSSLVETATLQIIDSSGQIGSVSISSGGSGGGGSVPLAAISMTPEGSGIVGGGGCSASSFSLGMVADGGTGIPNGDQIFCGTNGTTLSTSNVITNVYITAGGAHVPGGYSCPSGYTRLGAVADCQGGSCSGDQNVCVAKGRYGSASQVVYDMYITPEGARSLNAPVCNSGFTSVGQIADCYQATCYGLQSVCVQY